MAASWSSARPARTISVRMHSSSSPTALGMPVSCACAACALGALRPPLIIGGRTSGGASASGSVSPPVARYQLHAPSPGASLAAARTSSRQRQPFRSGDGPGSDIRTRAVYTVRAGRDGAHGQNHRAPHPRIARCVRSAAPSVGRPAPNMPSEIVHTDEPLAKLLGSRLGSVLRFSGVNTHCSGFRLCVLVLKDRRQARRRKPRGSTCFPPSVGTPVGD